MVGTAARQVLGRVVAALLSGITIGLLFEAVLLILTRPHSVLTYWLHTGVWLGAGAILVGLATALLHFGLVKSTRISVTVLWVIGAFGAGILRHALFAVSVGNDLVAGLWVK